MTHVIMLKRLLLLFWATWFSIVFFSNLADGLKALQWLGSSWAFASGNFQFIKETTARYGTPAWLNGILFAVVILWEGITAALFLASGLEFSPYWAGTQVSVFSFHGFSAFVGSVPYRR